MSATADRLAAALVDVANLVAETPVPDSSAPSTPARCGMTARAYPLPPLDEDPRFTFGLLVDLAKVLAVHGYPPISSGVDLVALRQALFGFLYADTPVDAHAEGICACGEGLCPADQVAIVAVDDENDVDPTGRAACAACGHLQVLHTDGFGCSAWVLDADDQGAYCRCGQQTHERAELDSPIASITEPVDEFAPAGDPADEAPPTAAELAWARAHLAEHVTGTILDAGDYARAWLGDGPLLYRRTLRKGLALAAVATELAALDTAAGGAA